MLVVGMSATAYGQTSGDKLYNQGLSLQKTMTVSAQKSAISKFQSAKKLYDSAQKKAQCDNAIAVSQNIIANLSKRTPSAKKTTEKEPKAVEEPKSIKLEVGTTTHSFEREGGEITVMVTTDAPEWEVEAMPDKTGGSFLTVTKLNRDCFVVKCAPHKGYGTRYQTVIVKAGDKQESVAISEAGLEPYLDASEKIMQFKAKGQKKKIEVYCNSDEEYKDNNNLNWEIVSKPDWLDVAVDNSKPKNIFKKGLEGAKKLMESNDGGEGIQTTNLVLYAAPMSVEDREKGGARRGILKLGSGEKRLTITIHQQ